MTMKKTKKITFVYDPVERVVSNIIWYLLIKKSFKIYQFSPVAHLKSNNIE